jgi:putative acetyltransferase
MSVVIRRGRPEESDAVAGVYRVTAAREWPFLAPRTHDEDRASCRTAFVKGAVWVAEDHGGLVGFCATRRGWIDHVYVLHERHGEGIGQALLKQALKGRTHVRLWTLQSNTRTRAFYRRFGFDEVLLTDGSPDSGGRPNVMLAWRRR